MVGGYDYGLFLGYGFRFSFHGLFMFRVELILEVGVVPYYGFIFILGTF